MHLPLLGVHKRVLVRQEPQLRLRQLLPGHVLPRPVLEHLSRMLRSEEIQKIVLPLALRARKPRKELSANVVHST